MNIRTTLAIAALAIMGSSAAMAQSANVNAPLTRAEVRQSVIAARNAGQLFVSGDAYEYSQPQAVMPSSLQRSTVHADVLAAAAAGALVDDGEGNGAIVARASTGSSLTRADVKLATAQARDAGELISVGEGDASEYAQDRAQQQYVHMAYLARKAMPVVASN